MSKTENISYVSDPGKLSAAQLIAYILKQHHDYVRAEAVSLRRQADEARASLGAKYPELARIDVVVGDILLDMDIHQTKEEKMLFPYIEALAAATEAGSKETPKSCFGDVRNPIRVMEAEHAHVHALLEELRVLTQDFTAPEPALADFYDRLKRFAENTDRHVYVENEVLFKKAVGLQDSVGN
jgi:regulator of cell morphogenesis and NO signaling